MNNRLSNETKFKNAESPFTEIFSLLKRDEILSKGMTSLVYETKKLKVMRQHANNAMYILLQGLQDLGNLIGKAANDKKNIKKDLNSIGFFISGVSNLAEALNTLKLDTDYVLRKRAKNG